MDQLKAGDRAPAFTLKNQDGKTVKLSDFKGKKLLLFFYPKANTSGCTAQARSVSEALPTLAKLKIAAAGISPDDEKSQKKFDEKQNLGLPLLSDPSHDVAAKYGVWGKKKMYGKEYEGIIRSVFLIDEKGKIIEALYKVSPKDTVPKSLEAIEGI